jgi:hypothetical protein
LYRRALGIIEGREAKDDPFLSQVLIELGLLRSSRQDHAGEEQESWRLLTIREARFGPDHPTVADCLDYIGGACRDQRKLGDAEAAFRRFLDIRRKRLDPGDPTLAWSELHLGSIASMRGDLSEVRERFARASSVWDKALPPGHGDGLNALVHLAQARWRAGRKDEGPSLALEDYRRTRTADPSSRPENRMVNEHSVRALRRMGLQSHADVLAQKTPAFEEPREAIE